MDRWPEVHVALGDKPTPTTCATGFRGFWDSGDWPRIASSAFFKVCDMLTASQRVHVNKGGSDA